MAQQPNVDITEAERPRRVPEPAPASPWRADKPGIASGPSDVPASGLFGLPGPDHGWAHKVVAQAELPSDDSRLRAVVLCLVQARAAACGRAAMPSDIEVALMLLGYGDDLPAELGDRRERWLEAVPHERRAGSTALAEIDRGLLAEPAGKVAYALRRVQPGNSPAAD